MVAIYVVSAEKGAGKTAVCAGMANLWRSSGREVGYSKPADEGGGDGGDAAFMSQVLGLSGDEASQGKDTMLVEAMIGANADDTLSQATYQTAREMSARVIAVEAYAGPSKYLESYRGFGDGLLGVIWNKVPQSQLKSLQDDSSQQFGADGINVLGMIPEDRLMLALTIGELADGIEGKVLNHAEKSAELVENFMLGAMVVDSGLDYFGRKQNKAAVVRQDRPDMQLAALETSTRCLVLSGSNEPPVYSVLEKAENRGIPIIASGRATADIVTGIEEALGESRFHQEKKLSRLTEIMKSLGLQAVL